MADRTSGKYTALLHSQVASPEDTSNFDSTNTEAGWAGIDKRHRYESTGVFKDF